MIEIRVNSRVELCKAMVKAGRELPIGQSIALSFEGASSCIATVFRHDQNTLMCSGSMLDGSARVKFRSQVALWGYNAEFPGPKVSDPESLLTRSGDYRPASVSDLYEGGARFSAESCPRVKVGKDLSPEGSKLGKSAEKAMRAWLRSLPEDQRKGFKSRKVKRAQDSEESEAA